MKEEEIWALKVQLREVKASLTEDLGLRGRDLENLKLQMEQANQEQEALLGQKTEQLSRLEIELSERDRRLAELSVTKESELNNIQIQLMEKGARLQEVLAMSEEEARQLAEMRHIIEAKDYQISGLNAQIAEKVKELELTQRALQRHALAPQQPTQELQQRQVYPYPRNLPYRQKEQSWRRVGDDALKIVPSMAAFNSVLLHRGIILSLVNFRLYTRSCRKVRVANRASSRRPPRLRPTSLTSPCTCCTSGTSAARSSPTS
jgi:hypothetical protein